MSGEDLRQEAWARAAERDARAAPRQPEGEGLHQLAAEFDAAPDDAEWEPPHPIFQMAQERDTLRQQRDKLAGLLREAIPDVELSIGEGYEESAALFERINAALAEVEKAR